MLKGGEDIYKSALKLQLLSGEEGIGYFAARDIPVPFVEAGLPISNVRFDVCLDEAQQQDGQRRYWLTQLSSRDSFG